MDNSNNSILPGHITIEDAREGLRDKLYLNADYSESNAAASNQIDGLSLHDKHMAEIDGLILAALRDGHLVASYEHDGKPREIIKRYWKDKFFETHLYHGRGYIMVHGEQRAVWYQLGKAEFKAWLSAQGARQPKSGESKVSRPVGAPRGSGETDDSAKLNVMAELINSGKAATANRAATLTGSTASEIDRLRKKFRKIHSS